MGPGGWLGTRLGLLPLPILEPLEDLGSAASRVDEPLGALAGFLLCHYRGLLSGGGVKRRKVLSESERRFRSGGATASSG